MQTTQNGLISRTGKPLRHGVVDTAFVRSLAIHRQRVPTLQTRPRSLKHSSLKRRLSAIVAAHRQARHKLDTKHPAIANVMAGITAQIQSERHTKKATAYKRSACLVR